MTATGETRMPVYARKLSPKWRKAFADYERVSGFEAMYQDDIDSGEMTPRQAWNANVQWLEDVLADVVNIRTPPDLGNYIP